MNEWDEVVQSLGGGVPSAPRAGSPGFGAGNVPYASGMITGQDVSPQARQMMDKMPRPMASPTSPRPSPQPQGQPQQQMIGGQMYAAILQYLMSVIQQQTQDPSQNPRVRISSTGAATNRTY